jgi:hypothetical protein
MPMNTNYDSFYLPTRIAVSQCNNFVIAKHASTNAQAPLGLDDSGALKSSSELRIFGARRWMLNKYCFPGVPLDSE